MTFHYDIQGSLAPTSHRYFWLISTSQREIKLPVPLGLMRRASGTFRSNISNLRPEDAPFTLRLEARQPGPPNAPGQVVSNTLPLTWTDKAP